MGVEGNLECSFNTMSWGDRGWPLSSMNMWQMVPSHPSLEQKWILLSPLGCKPLEASSPLPPLLLYFCSEDQKYLKLDIIVCCFYVASVLLGISDPRMLILTNFMEQMFSSLFITTSMVPMWFLHIFRMLLALDFSARLTGMVRTFYHLQLGNHWTVWILSYVSDSYVSQGRTKILNKPKLFHDVILGVRIV